jgi:hypothetical protein
MEKASFTKRGSKRGGDFSPSNLAYFVKRSLKWGDLDALKCALKEAKIELISAKEAQKEVSISKLKTEVISPKEAQKTISPVKLETGVISPKEAKIEEISLPCSHV